MDEMEKYNAQGDISRNCIFLQKEIWTLMQGGRFGQWQKNFPHFWMAALLVLYALQGLQR